jgi:putative membrane protein
MTSHETLPVLNRTGMDDRGVVDLLHASNLGEAQLGTLATQRAVNADVRKFAEQMIRDHVMADGALFGAQGTTARWGLTRDILAGAVVGTDSTGHMAHTGSIGTTGSAGYAGTGIGTAGSNAAVTAASATASSSSGGTGTMATAGSIGTTGSAGYANAGSSTGMSGAAGSGSAVIASSTSPSADLRQATHGALTALSARKGDRFDGAYIDNQVAVHRWLLDNLDSTLIPAAKDAQLRAMLQQVRARVVEHLNMAQNLELKIRR